MNGSFAAESTTARNRVITSELFAPPLPTKGKKFGCQYQEDALQRRRVAQRTFCVREHTQAFDGGHIRRRINYSA